MSSSERDRVTATDETDREKERERQTDRVTQSEGEL